MQSRRNLEPRNGPVFAVVNHLVGGVLCGALPKLLLSVALVDCVHVLFS